MKILFDHPSPFLLAHGGFQVQIEQTKSALEKLGLEVEFLRWWDAEQSGDIIHFFGRPSGAYVDFAHQKKIRVVMAELLTGLGSRSRAALVMQRLGINFIRKILPPALWAKMGWDAYGKVDRALALTRWEAQLMREIFSASADRVEVVPNGVANEFLDPAEFEIVRGPRLVCTATLAERKRVLELAQAAVVAKTPVWIIGKPYADSDPYAQRFFQFVDQHPDVVRYEGAITDRKALATIYREARGFVLLSAMESLSLSALEAAACGCPLLLSDLPWARSYFGDDASYCPIESLKPTAACLRKFYAAAPEARIPSRPLCWAQVATKLKSIYEETLCLDHVAASDSIDLRARKYEQTVSCSTRNP